MSIIPTEADERLVYEDVNGSFWPEGKGRGVPGTFTVTDKRILFRSLSGWHHFLAIGVSMLIIFVLLAILGALFSYFINDMLYYDYWEVSDDAASLLIDARNEKYVIINTAFILLFGAIVIFLTASLMPLVMNRFLKYFPETVFLDIPISQISGFGRWRKPFIVRGLTIERQGHPPLRLAIPFRRVKKVFGDLHRSHYPGKKISGPLLSSAFLLAMFLTPSIVAVVALAWIADPDDVTAAFSVYDDTELHRVAAAGDVEAVRKLLEGGPDVNTPGFARVTPLHYAAAAGNRQLVELLVAKGADVNAPEIINWTPLHLAVLEGHAGIARILLDAGADPAATNVDGQNPLDFADAYNRRGNAHERKGDYDAAIGNFTQAIRLNPDFAEAYKNRGHVYLMKGDHDHARRDFNQAIDLDPADDGAYNFIAWLLATAPDPGARNGAEAVRLAEKAVSLKDIPNYRDTLAAAYAEAGRFEEAVRQQSRAIDMVRGQANRSTVAGFEERLSLYRQGKPYRDK